MERTTLKQKLKNYEAEFKKVHSRNPTKADIAQNKEIAAQYKQYNRSKTTLPPTALPLSKPAHAVPGLSKPSPRKIRTTPIDPKSWERVFDPNSKSATDQQLGPSPIKSNQKPFIPLLGPSPSTSSISTTLFAKFTASNDLSSIQSRGTNEHEHPTLKEVRGVKRSAEDPEVMPFEYDLPVKAAKLKKKSGSRWENSDVSDEASEGGIDDTNIKGGAKGSGRVKGKGKAKVKGTKGGEKVTKARSAVGRGGKGYKKAKKGGAEVVEEDSRELGVRKALGGGVKSLHRKDAEGNVVLELELADGEEGEEESDREENEEMDEDGTATKRKSRKLEKITIHSRRPYHRDAAKSQITASALSDGEAEEAEEDVRDTTTLFYKDNHDLLLSQDVFAAATEHRTNRQASVVTPSQSDDEDDTNDQIEQRQNRSPSKSHATSQSLTHSLDPALLELLSLRTSPSKSSSTSREKLRDLRVKKLLMEPLERGLHEKTAGGLEDLEVLERRRRGLGTRLDEDEERGRSEEDEEVDDDWEEEAEGWKDLGKGEMDDFDWDS